MDEGTDALTFFTAGVIGVLGTLAGVLLNDLLSVRRERRTAQARQRRALSAVIGELLDALSILDSARNRKAWWPPLDAPRDRAWERYSDDLAEILTDEEWNQLRMTYETHRSLNALRDVPKTDAPPGSSPADQMRWDRWPEAAPAADDSFKATWESVTMLGKFREPGKPGVATESSARSGRSMTKRDGHDETPA
jgi:hypothetical protein